MRLLHVIASVNPAHGGPIEGIKQRLPVLLSLGVDLELLCCDAPDSAWLNDSSLPVIHAMGPGYGGYQYSPKLISWLKVNAARYDAVIVSGLWQFHGFAVRNVLVGRQHPYFVFTHGMLDPWFKHRYPFKHLKKWLYWIFAEYQVLRDARAVLFTCEEERRLARESFWHYKCQERVVSYGTGGFNGDLAVLPDVFFKRYPNLKGKRILLFLSRIHEKKGCDQLIDAFASVAKDHSKVHLVMAGPDQVGWMSVLQLQAECLGISERITWTGMLTSEIKWGAFIAADAFVLPSHQENFGISVAEALSCGTPVLISKKVNIWREIEDAQAGLVEEDTVAGCQVLLRRWLALPDTERTMMRKNARECFVKHFESKRAAECLIETIKSLI